MKVAVSYSPTKNLDTAMPSKLGWPQLKTTDVVLVVSVTW